jgi:uncharacterized membrane protein
VIDAAQARPLRGVDRVGVWVVVATAWVGYAVVSLRVYAGHAYGYDLGIFDQVVRHYAHLHAPVADILAPGADDLGEHFSPVLALLAPLYWVRDDPRALLLAQALLVALSVWPVHRFARRRLAPWPSLVVAVAYALSWSLQWLVVFDVHEVAFAVPLVALAVVALDEDRTWLLVASCGALLLVREDMGLFVVAVAVVLAVRRRFRLAGALAAVGAVAFVVVTTLVVPSFAVDSSYHFWTYTALGADARDAVTRLLRRPWDVVRALVDQPAKVFTSVWLVLPTLFLSLGSWYVVLAAPFVAAQLLSSRVALWLPRYQYWAVVAPILMLAAIDTVGRLRARHGFVVVERAWVAWVALVPVVGMALVPSVYPMAQVPMLLDRPETHRAVADLASRVPGGVCVEAHPGAMPLLTPHARVFTLGRSGGRASWVLVDAEDPLVTTVDVRSYADDLLARGWTVVALDGSVTLLRGTATTDDGCSPS